MKIGKWILGALLLFGTLVSPVKADEAFVINQFTTDIVMNDDSSLDVTETIEVQFSEDRHGIFRDIISQGIEIEVIEVVNEKEEPWNYAEEYTYLTTRLRIGDGDKWVNGAQTYQIRYKVYNAVLNYYTHHELYWNATGTQWPVPIRHARGSVTYPKSVGLNNSSVRYRCFTGIYSSADQNCKSLQEGYRVNFETTQPLSAYEGMTVVVGIPPGHITAPASLNVSSNPDGAEMFVNGETEKRCETECLIEHLKPGEVVVNLKKFGYRQSAQTVSLISGQTSSISLEMKRAVWFAILIWALEIIFWLIILQPVYRYFKYGRDPRGRSAIIAEYESPDDLRPAEMGTLIDEKADLRDISGSIIDLAVRKYIKIKVLPDIQHKIFKKDDYEFHRLDDPSDDPGLSGFEREIIDSIFEKDKIKKLSALKYNFYTKLPDLKNKLYGTVVGKGYFSAPPDKVRKSSLGIAGLTIFVGLFLIPFEAAIFETFYSAAVFFNGLIALVLHRFMPRKTEKGMEAWQKAKGFERYLWVAERFRVKFEEKEHLFYKYLPYAMVLGVAEKWSKAFKDIYKTPPDWIEGMDAGHFNAGDFVHSMNSFSGKMLDTFTSTPAPAHSSGSSSGWSGGAYSGSSGFSSGGGFSGGGFGGGGGGSW